MKITSALNLLSKLLVKYDIDLDSPEFTSSDRQILQQAERDISFYSPDLSAKRSAQRQARASAQGRAGAVDARVTLTTKHPAAKSK